VRNVIFNGIGEGKCPICDSYVKPMQIVTICSDCSYGTHRERCIICGELGVSDAYYCRECIILEKDVLIYFTERWLSKNH
jgi:hypothetical protein